METIAAPGGVVALRMLVGGRWVASETGETFDAVSPATGARIAEVPSGSRADVGRAVEAAHRARSAMAAMGAFDRARLLHRMGDAVERHSTDLAHWLTLDQGKPYHAEALGEVEECVAYFRIAAEDVKRLDSRVIPSAGGKLIFTLRVPRGVYGLITPWNWPLTMAAELIAPALAGGNTVVWTPSPDTAAVSVKLAEILSEADLPEGALNLVTGMGPVVGDEVAGHPLVAGVGFIGSTATGQRVARRAAGKHVMLEMGGNGPIVVFEDANLPKAVAGTVAGCFLCAGQSCTAGERILVQRSVQDEYTSLLLDEVSRLRLGDPFEEGTTLGPMNNERTARKMDDHVADARAHGAEVLTGGARDSGRPTQLYYQATVLSGVQADMRVSREETFGPIAPIISFATEEQALEIANDSPYGLLGAVFTRDLARALRFVDRMDAGWVNVNESSNYWESHVPFGGRAGKESGIGRVGGHFAVEQMTDLKTVVVDKDD